MKLTDNMPMPFGKHKGTAMVNVPAWYLIFIYDKGLPDGNVKDYIEENMELLRNEISNEQSKSKD